VLLYSVPEVLRPSRPKTQFITPEDIVK